MRAMMKSQMGGPGSGPKPGHRSPWYDRGSKAKPKGTTGSGTADDPIVTSDVEAAAAALAEDKYVRLNQPDEVATLLDELAANVAEAKAAGADAPNYNLCKVSVPGTNLFCVESKGIPRIKMPQLSGRPTPGSPADALPRDSDGKVDLSAAFIEHMQTQGIGTETKNVPASHLRASQNELNGAKVAGISNAIESGDFVPADAAPIFVTSDNYVVDGHHRWAATVGAEYATGGDIDFPVNMLDTDIITALAMANDFATEMGLPQQAMSIFGGPGSGPKPGVKSPWYDRPSKPRPHTPGQLPQLPSDNPDESRIMAAAPKPNDREAYAIDQYTGPAYREINAHFRTGATLPDEMSATVTDLETYINHSRLPECTVYRGMTLAPDVASSLEPGAVVTDPGFMSTTYDRRNRLIRDQNIELRLHVEAGTNGAWLGYATRHPGDQEVLFNPGTSYEITAVNEDSLGRIIVDADVINDRPLPAMAVDEIRATIRRARATAAYAVFGGPGSGPKPGHKSPWYERGSKNPDKMTPEQKAAEIESIRGGFASSEDKRIAQGLAERGPDGGIVYLGELADQRAAIRDKWVQNSEPVAEPEILFMGGGPAAGKTTALTSGFVEGSPDVGDPVTGVKGDAVLVAADDLKQKEFVGAGPMGDYQRLVELGDKTAAGWIHEESSSLSKEIYKAGRESGRNVVVDALANTSVEEMRAKIAEARKSASKVRAVYATVPTEDAVTRMKERLERTGRGVAEPVVRETHAAVSRILPEISGEFDSVALIDTSGPMGSKPTLVMSNTLGGEATIHDPELWQRFIAKGSEGSERMVASVFADDGVEVVEAAPSVLALYLAVLQGREYIGPESGRVLFDEIVAAVDAMDGVPDVPAEVPAPDAEAVGPAVFGGPGSGPKPGHRSPWYDRGSKARHPLTVGRRKPQRILRDRLAGGPIDQLKLINEFPAKAEQINESLRTRKVMEIDESIPINDLNDYLKSTEIPEAVTVYRGMDLDPAVADAIVPGSSFQNPGFTSTTLLPPSEAGSPAAGAPVVVEIEIPAGTKGAYISDLNGDAHDEVLFPQNMNLRVDSRDGDIVRATVIEPHIPPGRGAPRGDLLLASTEPPPFL